MPPSTPTQKASASERSDHHALSVRDLLALQQSPSPEMRANIAEKIGNNIDLYALTDEQFALALDIAGLLLQDKQESVRIALAEGLKTSRKTPLDMIMQLAQDDSGKVAALILRHCDRLTDKNLFSIIQTTEELLRLVAIAERDKVSSEVTEALIEKEIEDVAAALVRNPGATFTEKSYDKTARLYTNSADVLHGMMERNPVPSEAINKMMARAANQAPQRQPSQGARDTQFSSDAVATDMEDLLGLGDSPAENDCIKLAEELNRTGRLTSPTLILALCLGQRELFAACMGKRTSISLSEALALMDAETGKFRVLYNRSRLPSGVFKLFEHLVQSSNQATQDGKARNTLAYIESMQEQIEMAMDQGVRFADRLAKPIAEEAHKIISNS